MKKHSYGAPIILTTGTVRTRHLTLSVQLTVYTHSLAIRYNNQTFSDSNILHKPARNKTMTDKYIALGCVPGTGEHIPRHLIPPLFWVNQFVPSAKQMTLIL